MGTTTIYFDRDAFMQLLTSRHIALNDVGPMLGKSVAWASVIKSRGHMGFYAADELACALGMHVDELLDIIDIERKPDTPPPCVVEALVEQINLLRAELHLPEWSLDEVAS